MDANKTIKDIKSIYRVSMLKYMWTSMFGRHFNVDRIVDAETNERIELKEALMSITDGCILITDIDSSLTGITRAPFIIKSLKNKKYLQFNQSYAYFDENNCEVIINYGTSSSVVKCFVDLSIGGKKYMITGV